MKSTKRTVSWILAAGIGLFLVQGCIGKRKQALTFDIKELDSQKDIIPVAILGKGPAGLSAAGYVARFGWPPVIFEGPKPGGLLMETTWVENWPGSIKILGQDIIDQLERWASKQPEVQFASEVVDSIDLSRWPFKIHTESGLTVYALAVIIATGALPEKLGVSGEDTYWASGVSSCAVCDAPFFKDKRVVVVGGGDSAIEEAMQLAQHAHHVTVMVRKDQMRASAQMQNHLKEYSNVTVLFNKEVKEILGDGSSVIGIKVFDNKTNKTEEMPIDGVFLAIGHKPNSSLVAGQVDLDAHHFILTQGKTQKTSVQGVFAAGDVEDSLYRQAATAQGKGVQAGLDADRFLREIGLSADKIKQIEARLFKVQKDKTLLIEIQSITELEKYLSAPGVVFVDFYAQYCPTCIQMMPTVDAVAHEFASQAVFLKADIDVATDIVTQYKVPKVPYIIIFKDGAPIATYNKIMTRAELQEILSIAVK